MEQKEVEERIKIIFHNLDFFVFYEEKLKKEGYPNEKIERQIDRFLDQLIELLKLRK